MSVDTSRDNKDAATREAVSYRMAFECRDVPLCMHYADAVRPADVARNLWVKMMFDALHELDSVQEEFDGAIASVDMEKVRKVAARPLFFFPQEITKEMK